MITNKAEKMPNSSGPCELLVGTLMNSKSKYDFLMASIEASIDKMMLISLTSTIEVHIVFHILFLMHVSLW